MIYMYSHIYEKNLLGVIAYLQLIYKPFNI